MPLTAVGISHRTAPIAVRERVALTPGALGPTARELLDRTGVDEVIVVSTCNRTEIYGHGASAEGRALMAALADLQRSDPGEFEPHLYEHRGADAAGHLFRVASGLDSLVLGESQILGQVRDAWREARDAGAIGGVLDRLFQHAFATAKGVRSETGIGDHPVSVPYTVTVLARQIFDDVAARRVLLVGAGEMVTLCGRHFREQGVRRIVVANRSPDRAEATADELGGRAVGLDQLGEVLADADIVVTSTASPEPIIDRAMMRQALRRRRRRPMFVVDIAVPRDVHPDVARLSDVYLFTIDDLQNVVDENIAERRRAAEAAEAGIQREIEAFMRWHRGKRAAAGLQRMRQQASVEGQELARRAINQIEQGGDPNEVVARMANTLTNRLLHGPTQRLREAVEAGDEEILRAIDRLYGSDDGDR